MIIVAKFVIVAGDEVLEWNNRSLIGKTYDEVHDVIAESRHEPQVELRVSRTITSSAGLTGGPPGVGVASQAPPGVGLDMGRGGPAMLGSDTSRLRGLPTSPSSHRTSSFPAPHLSSSTATGGSGVIRSSGTAGGRPTVTLSDPLGGTLMLNPNSSNSSATPLATRIQARHTRIHFFRSLP